MTIRTRGRLALGATAGVMLAALMPGTAVSAEDGAEAARGHGRLLFEDRYTDGFSTGEDGKWMVLGTEEWPEGDAHLSTSGGALNVIPTGVNPETGEPAYARSSAQQDDGGTGATGDHIKWIAFPNHYTADGTPGFEVPDTGSISCKHRLSAEIHGVENHPFGDAVVDPQSDLRLASAAVISADFESQAIADFSVTNSVIYAIYERLPSATEDYAAYSYAIPVARTEPGEMHDLEIRFDRSGKRVTWLVDGRRTLSTDRIGTYAFDRKWLTVDHGGTEERLELDQMTCGMGLGSLLDGARPGAEDGTALVRLDSSPDFYFDPRQGEPVPQTFVAPESHESSRLFGQGTEMNIGWTGVIRRY